MRHFDTFEALEKFLREPLITTTGRQSFPPYTVKQSKDGNVTKIEVALAGFKMDDVEVEFVEGWMHIRGKAPETESPEWVVIHKGIAARKFELSFAVNQNYEGDSAEMADGILTITLKRVTGFSKKLPIQPKQQQLEHNKQLLVE